MPKGVFMNKSYYPLQPLSKMQVAVLTSVLQFYQTAIWNINTYLSCRTEPKFPFFNSGSCGETLTLSLQKSEYCNIVFWPIWTHFESFCLLDPFWPIWTHFEPSGSFGPILTHLDLSGPVWTLWTHFDTFGTILGPFGPILTYLDPFWPI